MARVRAVVRGRVQGVSYRMNARREASRHGVSGWVKNQRDGSVCLEAQGERDRVEAFLEWCRRGPTGAQVIDVELLWLPEADREPPYEERFEIRH